MAQVIKFERDGIDYELNIVKDEPVEDETGGYWGPDNHGISLADGYAFFRCHNIDLSLQEGTAGSDTPRILKLFDSSGKMSWGYIADADAAESLGGELLSNVDFEAGGTGGDFNGGAEIDDGTSDDYSNWTEDNVNDGAGDKCEATGTVHGGSVAAKLTFTTTAVVVRQNAAVTAGRLYKISFWTRGDGSVAGRYKIKDETAAAEIVEITSTEVTGVAYTQVDTYVTAPSGCAAMSLQLIAPATAGTCYFDDASIKVVNDVGATGLHIVDSRNGSTRNWVDVESGFNYNDSAYTFDIVKIGWCISTEWTPKIAKPLYGKLPLPVVEEFDIESAIPSGLTTPLMDLLAQEKQILDDLFAGADRYMKDRVEQHPVWLHAKVGSGDATFDETNERRALVRFVSQDGLTSHVAPPDQEGRGNILDGFEVLRLKVERMGLWERTANQQPASLASGAAASRLWDYTATAIAGSALGRIAYIRIDPSHNLGRVWAGIRSDAKIDDDAGNFVPVWECEDGTNNATETGIADAADATASDGNRVTVSEVDLNWDDEWHECLTLALSDVTANYGAQYGLMTWLLRASVTVGTWDVQLRIGYAGMDDDDLIQHSVVEVSNTSWDYHEMGEEYIPLRNTHTIPLSIGAAALDQNYDVEIWARRTSGAGNLYLDCLMPIPIDEGWLVVKDSDCGTAEYLFFLCSPEDIEQVLAYNATPAFIQFVPFSSHNFRLPPGDGRMVIAYARATSSTITDTIQIDGSVCSYYPCWYTMRGAD